VTFFFLLLENFCLRFSFDLQMPLERCFTCDSVPGRNRMVDILALCVASDFKVMNDSVCADRKEHQYAADDISAGHNEDAHHFHRLTTIRIIDGLMKEMKDMMICDGCKDFQKYGIFIIRLNEQISLLTESLADTVPEDLKGFVVEDVDNYMENFRNNELNSEEAQIQMRDFWKNISWNQRQIPVEIR